MNNDEDLDEGLKLAARAWARKIADAYLSGRSGILPPSFFGFADALRDKLRIRLVRLLGLSIPPEEWKFDGEEADGIDSALAEIEWSYGLSRGPRLGVIQWELGTIEMEQEQR